MLTWEYPPRIIGGIAPHVYDLSKALSRLGVEITIVTCDFPGAPKREHEGNIDVHRVDSYKAPTPDFPTWIYTMNSNLQLYTAELLGKGELKPDIIHAHDWLVAEAAIGLKHMFRIPLVATIHSTESGRRSGIHSDYQKMLHETEVWLTHEAWKNICCSDYMANHVSKVLGIPNDKIVKIPNGVNFRKFMLPLDKQAFRRKYATPNEKLVLFVGRMVYEKGVAVLVDAVRKVLKYTDAKFIFVGEGYLREPLMKKVQQMGLTDKLYFTGFLADSEVKKLYRAADVCVVPSLYEPFGIVCLEAMAAETPVVVSNVGGLAEIIHHEQNGVTVFSGDADSLAWGILRVLLDKRFSDNIAATALKQVKETYSWKSISIKTLEFYQGVKSQYEAGSWKPRSKETSTEYHNESIPYPESPDESVQLSSPLARATSQVYSQISVKDLTHEINQNRVQSREIEGI